MATGTRHTLSESDGLTGAPIPITASGTDGSEITGTLLHTATTSPGVIDEVFIYPANQATASGGVTIQVGGTDPNQHDISLGVASRQGLFQAMPGIPVASGAEIRAYADHALVTVTGARVMGWVNRIAN